MAEDSDPRLEKYLRWTTADAEGRFEFTQVPPGDYFVTTKIVWAAPVGYHGALVPQGGVICQRASVKDGETMTVMVTR